MNRLLVPILIAFIFSHLACALSESSISASNNVLDKLIAGDGLRGLDTSADERFSSFDHSNESDSRSNNDEIEYRIANSYSTSYISSKLDRLCAGGTDFDGVESSYRISSSDLGSYAEANLNRLLSERGTIGEFAENAVEENDHGTSRDVNLNLVDDVYITSYPPFNRSYLYKDEKIFAPNSAKSESICYRYESRSFVDKKSADVVHDMDLSFGYVKIDPEKEALTSDHPSKWDLSSCQVGPLATSSSEIRRIKKYTPPEVNQNLDVLIRNNGESYEHFMPYLFGRWDAEQENDNEKSEYPKNYAVVVGINSYKDWSSLQSPVNDAHEISKILDACGYEVLELTDETEMKPTKENILRAALDDIKTKQDDGNIIFYFSGHGVRGDDGTFYLVPQDAKSADISSCISEPELRGYLRDLDNLAVIIDACHSGDLKITDEGQLVLSSSKKDEPSNEKWFGSLSVFTYNLCKAVEEEMRSDGNISLTKCFYSARNDTVRWANLRLISQTPEIIDFTGENYYIK